MRVWQDEPPPARIEVPAESAPLEESVPEQSAPMPVPVYARPPRRWRHLVPLLVLAGGLVLTLMRDQSARDDASPPLFIHLAGPLTPGSEVTVTVGVRRCKGSETVHLKHGDKDLPTQVVQAPPGAEGKVTWQVQIPPEAHWCRLEVTTNTQLKFARVVPVRGP
jgi:hypothetical protein